MSKSRKWYAKDLGNGQGLVIEDGTGRHVAAVYDTEDRELVAAAPDLLEACQAARDFICTDGVCDSCGGSLKDGELPPHTGCVCGPILGALKKAGVSDR